MLRSLLNIVQEEFLMEVISGRPMMKKIAGTPAEE
jgi:hypothetical protein